MISINRLRDNAERADEGPGPTKAARELLFKQKQFQPVDVPCTAQYTPDETRVVWTPINYFTQYYDDDFWQLVSEQTNIWGLQRATTTELKTTPSEIRQLVGSHIVMGCLRVPRVQLCYQPIVKIPAVTQIQRDRHFKLRNNLHFVNNLDMT